MVIEEERQVDMVHEIVLRIFICTNYHHKVCTLTPCEFSTCSGEEKIEGVVRYYNNKLKDISKSCNNQSSPWGWYQ